MLAICFIMVSLDFTSKLVMPLMILLLGVNKKFYARMPLKVLSRRVEEHRAHLGVTFVGPCLGQSLVRRIRHFSFGRKDWLLELFNMRALYWRDVDWHLSRLWAWAVRGCRLGMDDCSVLLPCVGRCRSYIAAISDRCGVITCPPAVGIRTKNNIYIYIYFFFLVIPTTHQLVFLDTNCFLSMFSKPYVRKVVGFGGLRACSGIFFFLNYFSKP